MALRTRHYNQYSPQIITNNSEFVKINEAKLNNPVQMGSAIHFATTMENPQLGMHHHFPGMNSMMIQPQTNFVKVEGGLYNNLQNGPNKRSRESMEIQFYNLNMPPVTNNVPIQGFSPEINFQNDVQHFWDINYIHSQFNKNNNMEFETQKEREVNFMKAAGIALEVVERLQTQSENLSEMLKQNMKLQERMKRLKAETHVWKNKANTAEITAMSLRKEFDNILGMINKLNGPTNSVVVEEDAESWCASIDSVKNYQEVCQGTTRNSGFIDRNRMCKKCGERESSVLVLPCRHLCLCSVCGGSVEATCPVCNSCITTTVHVCLT